MITAAFALHGESTGHVRRMSNNDAEGYGPSYVMSKEEAFVMYLADSHWPNFYLIRADNLIEAIEHAEVVLCSVDEEAEHLASLGTMSIEDVLDGRDSTLTADGRIRTTWALRYCKLSRTTKENPL